MCVSRRRHLSLIHPGPHQSPTWLDLFLRAARSPAFESWAWHDECCWTCQEDGVVVRLYVHPLGRAYCADMCLGCHGLRVWFCDGDLSECDWDSLMRYPPRELYGRTCDGNAWRAENPAVAALTRAVEEAERAEHADWRASSGLRVLEPD